MRMTSRTWIKRLVIIVSLILNVGLAIVLFTPLSEQLHKGLIFNEEPKESQVIVVLSGGFHEPGIPGHQTCIRLLKGLEIYRDGWADNIICAGGTRLESNGKSVAQVMKETLVLWGVPEGNVLVQDESINTYNDITYLLNKFAGQFDFDQALFVTSAYHTYRVKRILDKKNLQSAVISASPWELHPYVWTERLDLFRKVAREYGAICYFWLRDWI
jgi:uncharacterized SAM-binding protein YcdF (DUF218 family)